MEKFPTPPHTSQHSFQHTLRAPKPTIPCQRMLPHPKPACTGSNRRHAAQQKAVSWDPINPVQSSYSSCTSPFSVLNSATAEHLAPLMCPDAHICFPKQARGGNCAPGENKSTPAPLTPAAPHSYDCEREMHSSRREGQQNGDVCGGCLPPPKPYPAKRVCPNTTGRGQAPRTKEEPVSSKSHELASPDKQPPVPFTAQCKTKGVQATTLRSSHRATEAPVQSFVWQLPDQGQCSYSKKVRRHSAVHQKVLHMHAVPPQSYIPHPQKYKKYLGLVHRKKDVSTPWVICPPGHTKSMD